MARGEREREREGRRAVHTCVCVREKERGGRKIEEEEEREEDGSGQKRKRDCWLHALPLFAACVSLPFPLSLSLSRFPALRAPRAAVLSAFSVPLLFFSPSFFFLSSSLLFQVATIFAYRGSASQ